jgi:hypothetical protein
MTEPRPSRTARDVRADLPLPGRRAADAVVDGPELHVVADPHAVLRPHCREEVQVRRACARVQAGSVRVRVRECAQA